MVAEEALEIIVDLLHKAGPIKTPQIAKVLFEDIETLAISYEDMDYQTERDLVKDDGWYHGDRCDLAKAGIEIAPPKFPAHRS